MSTDPWDGEWYCPSVDVCAWCGDCECGGMCFADLDPDNKDDHEAIEQLHAWIRRGRLAEQMEHALAHAENRSCSCDLTPPFGIPRPERGA